MTVSVTSLVLTPATEPERASGTLFWVRVALDGCLEINSIRARRTREGRIALAFPSRRDGNRRRHYFVRPLDDATRIAIESQVLAELRRRRLAS